MNQHDLRTRALPLTLLVIALSIPAFSQAPAASDPHSVPVVDGAIDDGDGVGIGSGGCLREGRDR